MNNAADITGPLAALVAGMVTSLHCAAMCGPLACSACTRRNGEGSLSAALIYHGSRLTAYTLVGLAAGLIGRRLSDALTGGATRMVAWVFLLFFLVVLTGLDKRFRLPAPAGALNWMRGFTGSWSTRGKAGALGFFTPLLPCAPLYFAVAAAGISGSMAAGGLTMAAFGLGTVPLLFVLQSQFSRLRRQWSPTTMDYARRGLALASIVVLLLRGNYHAATTCFMGP